MKKRQRFAGPDGNLAHLGFRTACARLCRNAGGELDQIQLLLRHVSIQTTEQ
jgi:integrase